MKNLLIITWYRIGYFTYDVDDTNDAVSAIKATIVQPGINYQNIGSVPAAHFLNSCSTMSIMLSYYALLIMII